MDRELTTNESAHQRNTTSKKIESNTSTSVLDEDPVVVAPPLGDKGHSTPAARRLVLARASLGEFVVTTLFLYCVMAASYNASSQSNIEMAVAPLVTGFSAVALIYSFADVSGAHFNPAVTIATIVTKKTSIFKGMWYIVAQILASIVATFLVAASFKDATATISGRLRCTVPEGQYGPKFMAEMMLTYVLVLVIFSVVFDTLDTKNVEVLEDAHRDGLIHKVQARNLTIYTTTGNSKAGFAPIAIGLTLGALTLIGGVFNPARATGPAVVSLEFKDLWLYWIGSVLGGVLGGLTQLGFAWLKHQAMLQEEFSLVGNAIL